MCKKRMKVASLVGGKYPVSTRETFVKLALMVPTIEYGVYINDSGRDYTGLIFDGLKTVETRDTNVLGKFEGQWVGIVRTGSPGRNGLCGYMLLGKGRKVDWRRFWSPENQGKHWVTAGSYYACAKGKHKWLYPIEDVIRLPLIRLKPTKAKGPRPWRRLQVGDAI